MSERSSSNALRKVLTFLFLHWRQEKWLAAGTALCMTLGTAADLLMPVYAGKLVDALAMHVTARSLAIHRALHAIAMMAILGILLTACGMPACPAFCG